MELKLDSYWQLPPISRNFATFTAILSLGFWSGLIRGYPWLYAPDLVWKFPPELWRIFTGFCITNKDFSIIFDTYFLYSYMSQLEIAHPRTSKTEDLLWYLTFVGGTILALTHLVASPGGLYIHPLLVAMAYTVTQQQQGMKVHYIIISFPAPMMPYAMIAINLLGQGGPEKAWFDAQGLIAAHLFEFLTSVWPQVGGGTNWMPTPYFYPAIIRFFAGLGSGAARVTQRSYGSMTTPAGRDSGSSSGVDTGPLPDSWRTRGSGRRLG